MEKRTLSQAEGDRLYWAREVLMDDLAEEVRAGNIDPQKAQEIADIVFKGYDDCAELVEADVADIEEIITYYYDCIKNILNKPNDIIL